MFSIDQIREAHSNVKSGADFPAYIQNLKELGVRAYEHYVADGHIQYYGTNDFMLSADAKWEPRSVAPQGDAAQLKQALMIHQQGLTDYPTFCQQSATAGVEKWVVDLEKMTCVYVDKRGSELVIEVIPTDN